jgi:hypothetical protein
MADIENNTGKDPINLPLIYSNGASVGLTLTDIHITATVNGKPACILAIPLSTAKSLAASLQQAVRDYELKTNTTVFDLKELSDLVFKSK